MKKAILIIIIVIAIIFIGLYYFVSHAPLYDMGTRGGNSHWMEAEYKKNNDKCYFILEDSTEIQIESGTTQLQHLVNKTYSTSGDTIIVIGNIEDLKPYVNTNKLLALGSRLYFHLDNSGQYDTSFAANIWLNRTKLGN